MSDNSEIRRSLEVASGVLLRCFVLGVILLLMWFVVFLVGGEMAYGIHSKLIDITKHEFDLLNYYGIAFLKVLVFVAFLIPYVAIRLVLRNLP
jgi:hypothetical protein